MRNSNATGSQVAPEKTMAAEASNRSQIIEVDEIAWEFMMANIKGKMLWTDTATKPPGAAHEVRAGRVAADASPCRRRATLRD
jgi:hypothetical protein